MSDFLLELRCEEIPARMQAKARADLEKLFTAQLKDAGLEASSITTYSTPRRLALIARGLPMQTEAVSEERKGPAANAPEQALAGFLRSTGLNREDLVEREVKGKAVLFAIIEKPGQPTTDILAAAIPAIIAAFPWPKSQRWGEASISSESLRWVRPLSSIIALFDGDVVDCEVHGIASGRETMGHRFMANNAVRAEPVEARETGSNTLRQAQGERDSNSAITIGTANDYADTLRAAHVIVDHEERQNIVRDGAAKAASDAGLSLVEDEGLVIENAGLTEWPVPLLGRFDEAFLDVPEEVIQLTTRINQKYFVVRDSSGTLTNAFVCTANIHAIDGGSAIVAGNEKVLAARLGDAKFFWELDQKTPLAVHAEKLSNIVFHEKLGTVADKVERVAKLARWLCEEGIVKPLANNTVRPEPVEGQDHTVHTSTSSARTAEELADLAEQAAKLCKADLVTEMVGEFPELQGLMGGYYAAKEGLPIEVSDAIRDHYKPVGQSDDVPSAPVTVAVSLADKLDTLACFFAIDEKPTGSKDPFALRRAALSYISLITINNLRLSANGLIEFAHNSAIMSAITSFNMDDVAAIRENEFGEDVVSLAEHNRVMGRLAEGKIDNKWHKLLSSYNSIASSGLTNFLIDRLKVQQKEAGVRHDLIDAVFALGGEDDLVRLLARVHALQDFVTTDDGVNLLAGYKRASNILKKEAPDTLDNSNDMNNSEIVIFEAPSDEPEQSTALQNALNAAEPKAVAAIESEDFEGAMSALASLRTPIDAFFDNVMVNDEDESKKKYRLGLLSRFRDAVHRVADFSKIEG